MYPCSPTYGCHGPGLYGGRLIGLVVGCIIFVLLCLLLLWFINRRRRRRYLDETALPANPGPLVVWSPPLPRTGREAWYGSPGMMRYVPGASPVARELSPPQYSEYQYPSTASSRSLPPLPSPTYRAPGQSSYHRINDFVGGFRMNATHQV